MSQSFSEEDKEKLTQALARIRKNVIYVTEQLESVILKGAMPADPESVARVIALMDHFIGRLQKPADTINLQMMEKEMDLTTPPDDHV